LVKVNVVEHPACKRVLEIEIPVEDVEREMNALVEEYRRSMVLPGFRKGKAPMNLVRAKVGDSLQSEFLKRALPKAYMEAVEETKVHPAGNPEIKDLKFKSGEPLRFEAHIEIWPPGEIGGYRELAMVREEFEITDEDIDRSLSNFRESRAAYEPVDRPAQGTDQVLVTYWVVDAAGERGEEKEGLIEVGGSGTPEPFNQALMGALKGESRRVVLPATTHTTEEGVHEHPEQVFEVIVKEVREKKLPDLDDAFAKEALGKEDGTLEEMRARVRLNLEAQEGLRSREAFEETLFDEIIARNPVDLPEGVVKESLDDIVERARRERDGTLSTEDEEQIRTAYRPAVEKRLKSDLIVQKVGMQENVTVSDEEVDNEVKRYAEREGRPVAEVRGKLRKNNGLDRIHDDMYRFKVIQTLLGLAKIDVIKKRR